MKDRMACIVDEHNCSSEQLEEALMQCGDLLDLVALTQGLQDGRLDIYDMAERITNLLGHNEPLVSMATSEDEEEDNVVNGEEVEEENGQCGNDWDHHLLLAGYSDCMSEALRYLVEEERYSPEHPVVEGLRTHLSQQQDRVLLEAARSHHHHHRHAVQLDNSRVAGNNNNNQVVEVRNRMAFISDSMCNIRPPAT